MLPKYTYAVGGTDKIKKFIDWLTDQKQVHKSIQEKYERKEQYAI